MDTRPLWLAIGWFAGILAASLWLTCSAEPEPRVAPLAAYQLALDAGLLHDGDAR
jgi:hypothetical protein